MAIMCFSHSCYSSCSRLQLHEGFAGAAQDPPRVLQGGQVSATDMSRALCSCQSQKILRMALVSRNLMRVCRGYVDCGFDWSDLKREFSTWQSSFGRSSNNQGAQDDGRIICLVLMPALMRMAIVVYIATVGTMLIFGMTIGNIACYPKSMHGCTLAASTCCQFRLICSRVALLFLLLLRSLQWLLLVLLLSGQRLATTIPLHQRCQPPAMLLVLGSQEVADEPAESLLRRYRAEAL